MPASMTLNYFGLPGRAEATRVALAYAGKDFEDKRLSGPEYGASKWAGKGLPVLEMDGAEYTQSTALLTYAGKLGGLYPKDALAALKVDEIVMIGEDIMAKVFSCMGQKDDTVARGLLEGKIKTLLEVLVAKIAASPSKFCVGDSLTIADLQVHAVIANVEADFCTGIPPTLIKDTAAPLLEVQAAVMEDPKVKAYYTSKQA
eukprot:TRINITY_DN1610_c0_g1_i4.p2 TRINITY_DN1610_c0_g1~~TRINITY_DN1610_c0_g1_i4.p2  ORF type:complete len:202 (+),score=30.75 TRINITY_DN1610_c0_g1_i4:108-713(+)